MALVIPVGFAQVTVPLRQANVVRAAVITYGIDIDAWTGSFSDLANWMTLDFDFAWGSTLDSSVTIGPSTVTIGQDGTDNITVPGDVIATGNSDYTSPPPNVAVLVRKNTLLGGRRNRGRIYIPWAVNRLSIGETGIIDAAAVTDRQTDAGQWMTALDGTHGGNGPTPMVILHSSGQTTVPPPTDVSGLVVEARVATQRRRNRS